MVRQILREHREIALVLGLFVILGIFYSVTTPLFEAPDEQWHFAFVQHLATGRGLPVQSTGTLTHLARQEGSQPPLYYLLAVATTFWIDTSDFPEIVWENPHYGYGVPGIVNDNKNLFIHTSVESFPYRGAAFAIHLARWLSVLIGALAVLFTYLLSLEVFPDRKFFAASAGALVGFMPQFLFVSSAVSNDSTIVAMAALSLWMTIRLFLVAPRERDVIVLGLATGLAALAKVSGLGLVILAGLVLLYVLHRDFKTLVRYLLIFGVVVALVAGWWYLRNFFLYGELTGTVMMTKIFGARESPLTGWQLLTQLTEVWETFWVGFGWGNIRAPAWVYNVLAVVVVLCGIGLMLGFFHRRDRFHVTLVKALPFFVLAFWIVVAFAELVNWMQMTQAPHGRLFFPVLPAIAPLAVFGLTQWAPKNVQPFVARGAAAGLFILAAFAPFTILQPAYAFPAQLSANELPSTLYRVNINYGDKMKLIGYEISSRRVRPGDAVTLTLYWQALAEIDEDYSVGLHVVDANQRVIGARDSYPGHGLLPTRLWQAGQIIRDAYWLPISDGASAPSVAQIQITLYSLLTKRDLLATDPTAKSITPIIGQIKLIGNVVAPPPPRHATEVIFDKQIALVGYDIINAAAPSQGFELILHWKRLTPMADDYTVFVHALDANGKILAQQDRLAGNGNNPTSLWDADEVVVDRYRFNLPALTPGASHIELGLYMADTGERLQVVDGTNNPLSDSIKIPFEGAR